MIWTWFNNGRPQGFFKDEHSLLISYDMIPLRGLDKTREILNQEGRITAGQLVEGEGEALFVPFKNGQPDLAAIDWGCSAKGYDFCLRKLCFYVSFIPFYPKENKFGISNDENVTLRAFHWRSLSDDKRRQRPLIKIKPQVEKVLANLGFQIKQVKFVESI